MWLLIIFSLFIYFWPFIDSTFAVITSSDSNHIFTHLLPITNHIIELPVFSISHRINMIWDTRDNHNEDFATIEHHIKDLTQEKCSLQRVGDASRVLTRSLSSVNSALTDTDNHQLKSYMERLQYYMKKLRLNGGRNSGINVVTHPEGKTMIVL